MSEVTIQTHTIHKVKEIKHNQYIGSEYLDMEGVCFLFGDTVRKVNPELNLHIGDSVEVVRNRHNFVTSIRVLLKNGGE